MAITIIYTLYSILIALAIVVIVLENRNSYKAVAWILAVVFLPIVGFILYIIFGRDLRHTQYMKGEVYQNIIEDSQLQFPLEVKSQIAKVPLYYSISRLIEANSRSILREASSIEIYTQGKEKYKSLFRDIQQAQKHIHIEYYIIENDELGLALRHLLIQKAQEGVKVRILFDGIGSLRLSSNFWKSLEQAGGEVFGFFPLKFPYFQSHINYRNHRKIVVIDGSIGYIGGMNIANRYTKGDKLGHWRDTHFRFEGDAVSGLQRAFVIDWGVASKRNISSPDLWNCKKELFASIPMQIITNGSMRTWKTIEQAMIKSIFMSHNSILIQTPYFLPTEGISQALMAASLRGVRICIMIPYYGDSWVTKTASNSFLSDFMDMGVEIYLYKNGFLHSKLIMIDSKLSIIGSANIDYRSMELNMEINAFVYDKELTNRLELIFLEDSKKCLLLEKEDWNKRNKFHRYLDSIFRLLAPML